MRSITWRVGRLARFACLLLGLALAAQGGRAATLEQTALEHLDHLRSIQATSDSQAVARYIRQMDDAWRFFVANKATVAPLLREQLGSARHW